MKRMVAAVRARYGTRSLGGPCTPIELPPIPYVDPPPGGSPPPARNRIRTRGRGPIPTPRTSGAGGWRSWGRRHASRAAVPPGEIARRGRSVRISVIQIMIRIASKAYLG